MRAEEMRESWTFSRREAPVDDGYGNANGEFVDQFTVAARVRPRIGGEEVFAARMEGRTLASVTIRYSPAAAGITSDWRATDTRTGDVWNIRAPPVNPDEKKQWLEMTCEAVKSVAPPAA